MCDILDKIQLGMSRTEVRTILGDPDEYNLGTRKYPKPTIYKYNIIGLYFTYPKDDDGKLYMAMNES